MNKVKILVYRLYIQMLKMTFFKDLKVLNWGFCKLSFIFGLRIIKLKIRSFSVHFKPNVIVAEKTLITYGPKEIDGSQNKVSRILPALNFYKINKAIVNANSPIIISRKEGYYQEYPTGDSNIEMIDFAHGHVIAHDGDSILVDVNINSKVEKGIFLGGSWPTNWYHWTIEIMSKVELINQISKEYEDFPLLIPSKVLKSKNHIDFLRLLFDKRKTIDLKYNTEVESLIYIDSPAISSPKMKYKDDSAYDRLKMGLFRTDILNDYRNLVLKKVNHFNQSDSNLSSFKRIYLARHRSTRIFNHADVIERLKKYNFEPIYLEDHNVNEQLKILGNADFIIGPTGAAWANLLFSNASNAIILMPKFLVGVPTFPTIAKTAGVDLTFYRFPTESKSWVEFMRANEECLIDLDVLEGLVQKKINDTSY